VRRGQAVARPGRSGPAYQVSYCAAAGHSRRIRVLLPAAQGARSKYITAIWGWDEQVQRAFRKRAFNPHPMADHHRRAGRCRHAGCRLPPPGEIYLSRIEIHPGRQGHGIDTRIRIISALLEEAEPVRLAFCIVTMAAPTFMSFLRGTCM
jgi:GNAT superfamily N-acetyltransferase